MLVLSRKKGESIMIGHDIELIVIDVDGEQVKLGIQAPKHVRVYRKEVYRSIQESNKEASAAKLSLKDLIQMNQKMKKSTDDQ